MATYVYSTDGTTITTVRQGLPQQFVRRLDTGDWSIAEPETAEEFGFYLVPEVPQPTPDHVMAIVNVAPGQFVQRWTFDQATANANAARALRDQKRTNVENAVATLRTWAADAATTNVTNGNNNAVTQVLVDRLGIFFDRFADLVESS